MALSVAGCLGKLPTTRRPLLSAVVMNNCKNYFLQVAGITSAGGKPRNRPKPFDYRNKKYSHFHQITDRTTHRLDENSRVIVIDGPMASGKTEFAKKLAHELDFKFVPQANVNDMYLAPNGLTYTDLDDLLPPQYRMYDLDTFYKDKTPKKVDGGRAGQLQVEFFTARLNTYNDALLHLLSTGQGVVCVRSPWTDRVFAKALYDNGYMCRNGYNCYTDYIVRNHICDFPRPHLVIYLDADVAQTKENIKRRNNELEVNSTILTDDYLQSIENEYKNSVLPALEEHSELLVYPSIPDITEHEVALMVEDIEALGSMEHSKLADDHFLDDWSHMTNEELAYKRRVYQDLRATFHSSTHVPPGDGGLIREAEFHETRDRHYKGDSFGGWKYATGTDSRLYPSWKIMLGMTPKPTERRHFWIPA